jgi:pyrroloquinoline quinone (PQQ) biosynthesis protein C|tara:strand:- start:57 stop:290 length:234 start_codon:yes stop_codon:yes gene_type:complete
MQLFEFFNAIDDDRYNSFKDQTRYEMDEDTRKSRLTLEMINNLRMHMQARRKEKQSALELYQKMYGGSIADAAEPTL